MYLEDKNQNPGIDPLTEVRKNRGELIALLRDKARWPEGFEWDYSSCASCAMGLLLASLGISGDEAEVAYASVINPRLYSERSFIACRLGLGGSEAETIFADAWTVIPGVITPEHVAALLEAAPFSLPIGERIALPSTTE